MPVIVKRPRVNADLGEIWDYIADDSEARADAFIDAIGKTFHALAGQPGMGRICDELLVGLRSFPIGRYVVFYRALPNGVEIIRVLHGARDVDAIFPDNA